MYLKIVTDEEIHYIKCDGHVSVKQGAGEAALTLMVQKGNAPTNPISISFKLDDGETITTVVTDGKVYLLDDSGKTVDVIQR